MVMDRRFTTSHVVVLAGLCFLLLLQMSVSAAAAQNTVNVAFVYSGPVSDHGWSYAHHQGLKHLQEVFGDRVETTHVESVSVSDAPRVFDQLVQRGNDIVFGTSGGFMDPILKTAKQYPGVRFEQCDGWKTRDNLAAYFAKSYQATYLTGLIAGKMTESNTIGYVAAHPIPSVIFDINAFALAVREVNPEAHVRVVWTNTWYDPAKEKDAALSVIDAGADVVAMRQDSPGPLQAAQERGVYAFGYHTDMQRFAPDAYLTAPVWDWGKYYEQTVRNVLEGDWETHDYFGGMKDGVVDIAPMSDLVPDRVQKLVKTKKQAILDERLTVFEGPIHKKNGERVAAEGETLSYETIRGMNWFVEGIKGTIPEGGH